MRNKVAIALIILGLLVVAYPLANRLYIHYWESKLLAEFEEQIDFSIEAEAEAESEFNALQEIFEVESDEADESEEALQNTSEPSTEPLTEPTTEELTAPDMPDIPTQAADQETTSSQPAMPSGTLGKIVIPKIELTMPILQGASDYNLDRGAATIEGTSTIGEIGNVGIAGHRGRSFGIMFNRLDEMEKGDLIEIQTNSKTYKYRVYKTHLVEPTDVSVLYRNDTHRVLTLVTCDPVRNPTHRLIVHAVLEP